ncbi:secretion system protein [Capsulimonas corticalis]|uniref:Secretion system protein n=1 Tax=Capsulimonas corticalis TaxID=2219043 RepID=A0A402CQ13_9BACT|nr:type II secretion system F family protein [Capsulimonas corticalis]BDI32819.1 secretion system protein [Capsulimonas corticalis]
MSPLIIVAAIFVVTCGGVYAITEVMAQRSRRVRERLSNITGGFTYGAAGVLEPMEEPAVAKSMFSSAGGDILPTVSAYLQGSNLGRDLRMAMHRAGIKLRPAEFVGICIASIIGMAMIGLFLTSRIWMALVMGAVGYIVPVVMLKMKQETRRKDFDAQLPDALTLISSSLRTGYSFTSSCEMIITEMPAPISEEFAWARGEAQLGVPMEIALGRMVDRVNSYDLDLAVTAVSIQIQVGGNLAEILDTIAKTIRERVRIKGEINSLTAEGKLSGVIVFLLPIVLGLFLNLRSPDYFKPMLEDPIGMPMIIATFVFQVVGGLIIKKMVAIDV